VASAHRNAKGYGKNTMPEIRSITYRPEQSAAPLPAAGYLRVALTEATLVEGRGIEHDANARPQRNLNVMDAVTLAELAAEGFPTTPGALGENIVVAGLDLRSLPQGVRLQIGEQAVIEITAPRTGCVKLHAVDARMPEQAQGRVGVMCQVVKAGRIRVGDTVERIT
jgi:TatD DNase family protein